MLVIFANYNGFCKLYLVGGRPDSVLSNFIGANWTKTWCFIFLNHVLLYWKPWKCQSGLLYHWVPVLNSALGRRGVVARPYSIGILMYSRIKCHCCELLLIINNLPVCNFFRKPGNMLFRKLSTCLIRGQNFTLRTLRQNTPLVTGLWVFLL